MQKRKKVAAGLVASGIGFMALSFASTEAESGTVVASHYGEELRGSPTASGEPFNPDGFTAASKTLPLGTRLTVCKDDCTEVRINDRGPFVPGRDLDLSTAAAKKIGVDGVAAVEVERVDSPRPTTEAPEPAEMPELPRTGGIGQ